MLLNIVNAYTQTLYKIALKHVLLSQIHTDIKNFLAVYNENVGFRCFVNNPTITKNYKQQVLKATLKPYLHSTTLAFVCFVINKGRFVHLKNIFEAFIEEYKKYNKVKTAYVTTTTKLNNTLRHELKALVTKLTGHTCVELIEYTNPSLLGGYVLQIDDRQIDASLARQFKRLKHLVINQ